MTDPTLNSKSIAKIRKYMHDPRYSAIVSWWEERIRFKTQLKHIEAFVHDYDYIRFENAAHGDWFQWVSTEALHRDYQLWLGDRTMPVAHAAFSQTVRMMASAQPKSQSRWSGDRHELSSLKINKPGLKFSAHPYHQRFMSRIVDMTGRAV